jgi:hypothetical protein
MKMRKSQQYLMLSGIGLLVIVIIILLLSPSLVFSSVTIISTDIYKSTTDQVSVITKTDFNSPDQTKIFPLDIGKWHGRDFDATQVVQALGADIVLIRGYDPETFTQPLYFTVVQAKTDSSIDSPTYCFPSQGYTIKENKVEYINITSSQWTTKETNINLPLNQMVVTKSASDGSLYERRLVLYFFVKGNQFYNDTITMIEVQGLVPLQGSYEGTLKEAKEFLSEAIPLMFEPGDNNSQWHPLLMTIAEKGVGGYVALCVIFLIPLILILYPLIRSRVISG